MTTALLDAVDALTLRWHVDVRDDDGKLLTRIRHKPRLDMLTDAIISSTNKNGGGALARERDVMNSQAAQMRIDYKRAINKAAAVMGVAAGEPVPTLRAWYAATLSKVVTDSFADEWIGTLTRWAQEIDNLLNPPETVTVEAACPLCEATFFTDKEGREVPWPIRARKWDIRQHGTDAADASCIVCGGRWDGLTAIRELAYELENRELRHADNGVA